MNEDKKLYWLWGTVVMMFLSTFLVPFWMGWDWAGGIVHVGMIFYSVLVNPILVGSFVEYFDDKMK